VYLFEHGRPVVKINLAEVGKPGDRLIDSVIPGGGDSHPGPF
jgi:hypothetical protein